MAPFHVGLLVHPDTEPEHNPETGAAEQTTVIIKVISCTGALILLHKLKYKMRTLVIVSTVFDNKSVSDKKKKMLKKNKKNSLKTFENSLF